MMKKSLRSPEAQVLNRCRHPRREADVLGLHSGASGYQKRQWRASVENDSWAELFLLTWVTGQFDQVGQRC